MKHCAKCGKELFDEAVVCPGCGCPTEAPKVAKKDPEANKKILGVACIAGGIVIIAVFIILVLSQL